VFCDRTRWADLLAGWELVDGTGDSTGSRWRHPTATSSCSATVKDGSLYVYSSNTPFEVTTEGDPHGYSKFRAYAVLQHGGDMRAAAAAIRAAKR
jgi:hypothetical protein